MSRAQVSVASQRAARTLGVRGVVVSVHRADGSARAGRVHVSVSSAGFAHAYGGDYGSRLRLVELPGCAMSTPALAACRTQRPLGSLNDVRRDWVGADVTLPAAASKAPAAPGAPANASGRLPAPQRSRPPDDARVGGVRARPGGVVGA